MAQQETEAARANRLLIETARNTTTDLYSLLSLPSPFSANADTPNPEPVTDSQLRKARRTIALKHHPDKNPGNEAEAAARLDEALKALEILQNPEARAAYDDKLRARFEKKIREAAFEGKRKRMKEELEARESAGKARRNGVMGSRPGTPSEPSGAEATNFGATSTGSPIAGQKRKFGSGTTFGGQSGRERSGPNSWMHSSVNGEEDATLRRLAAEGAKRRQEREDKLRKEREEAIKKEQEDEEDLAEARRRRQQDPQNNGDRSETSTPVKRFTFSTPNSQKSGVGGLNTPSSAAKNKNLLQSTMARLKEAQRRQSGVGSDREIIRTLNSSVSTLNRVT